MSILLMIMAAEAFVCGDSQQGKDDVFCSAQNLKRSDKELYQRWPRAFEGAREMDRKARSKHENADGLPSFEQALINSQRAWLRYRNTKCLVESYQSRFSRWQVRDDAYCKTQMNEDRMIALGLKARKK